MRAAARPIRATARPALASGSRPASSLGGGGGAAANSLAPTLYRSCRRAARFCDANTGLRRHLLTRLVREGIFIDSITTPEAIRRLADDKTFSMVRAVSAHFRRSAGASQQLEQPKDTAENDDPLDDAFHLPASEGGITQAFEALKIYRAAVERQQAKGLAFAKPFSLDATSNIPAGVDAAQHIAGN